MSLQQNILAALQRPELLLSAQRSSFSPAGTIVKLHSLGAPPFAPAETTWIGAPIA